jgi:hypothetical protein
MNISIEEIVSLAALQRKIDLNSPDEPASPSDMDAFKKDLDRLNSVRDFAMMTVARKLLDGKPYCITSDNPQTIKQFRSLAGHMGASVDECSDAGGLTKIIFGPPSRQ